MAKPKPSRYAAALQYLQQMRDRAADFGGGVVENLADRARSVGGLAYEAFTSDPNIGRMTTAEYAQAADRPTPRLDQAAQDLGTIGKAIVTQPIQTGKALVQGEVERARQAMTSSRAAGEYAGSMVDPMRIAAALRKTAPIAELDVYHGTPHKYAPTEANPLGEFDASKVGTGEGAQAYGHGIYLAENPGVAKSYIAAGGSQTNMPDSYAADIVGMMGNEEKALAHLKNILPPKGEKTFGGESRELIEQAIQNIESGAYKSRSGSLYKADLPDQMIDRMLDWDKPLSKDAPQAVKDAFNKLAQTYPELKEKLFSAYREGKPGSHYYSLLNDYAKTGDLVKNQLFASDAMRQAGIPGIRYLDAGSRGKGGTGTRNFVVFPGEEKKVRILERDGQKASPQKIAQALEAAPDYRMGHRPMTVEGGAARLDNAYEAFGEDIYGPNALRYFGGSDPRESGTVAALKRLRDNPDAEVTIYRGVPTDAKGGITKGDWVTLDKSAAQEYAELKPGQKGKVLAMKVKAKDVTTWPDSLLEFGYYPAD